MDPSPKTNSRLHLQIGKLQKGNEKVFQPSIFRCYVSFREGATSTCFFFTNYLIWIIPSKPWTPKRVSRRNLRSVKHPKKKHHSAYSRHFSNMPLEHTPDPEPTVYEGIVSFWGFRDAWGTLQGYVGVLLDLSMKLLDMFFAHQLQYQF